MEGARKEPFEELKKVAARLDVEIANAANCLNSSVNTLPTSAVTAFEQATALEAKFKLLECRLETIVKQKLASIQEMTECSENAHCDNKELLPKLVPRGFKVPDNVLPALQHMPPPGGQDSTHTPLNASCRSLDLQQPTVTKLEPVFSSMAMGSSHPSGRSQTSSYPSQRSLQPMNAKPASRSPSRHQSEAKSKLSRYLEEIGNDDSMLYLRRKPPQEEDFGAVANTASASHTPVVKEPSEAFESQGPTQSSADETYTCGDEPLPRTPEPTKNAFEENTTTQTRRELKAPEYDCRVSQLKFGKYGSTESPKTPELNESPAPALKESKVGVPW